MHVLSIGFHYVRVLVEYDEDKNFSNRTMKCVAMEDHENERRCVPSL